MHTFPMHIVTFHLNWYLDCIPNWGCVAVVFLSWRGILMFASVPAFVLLLSEARKIKEKKKLCYIWKYLQESAVLICFSYSLKNAIVKN